MDNSRLVSPAPPIGSRATNPTASKEQSSYIAAQPGTSLLEGQLTPSRMDSIGDRSQTEAFLMMQSQSSVDLGPLGLINSTIQPRRNGVAGASKGKLIYFRHLSMK